MWKNDTERDAIFAEEGFIADVQVAIESLLADKDMNRADLARALKVSQARVSQMFGDEANNLTLRTLARIFHVLGEELRITSARLDELFYSSSEFDEIVKRDWSTENIAKVIEALIPMRDAIVQSTREQSNDNESANALAA